jgi:hypothetical protein
LYWAANLEFGPIPLWYRAAHVAPLTARTPWGFSAADRWVPETWRPRVRRQQGPMGQPLVLSRALTGSTLALPCGVLAPGTASEAVCFFPAEIARATEYRDSWVLWGATRFSERHGVWPGAIPPCSPFIVSPVLLAKPNTELTSAAACVCGRIRDSRSLATLKARSGLHVIKRRRFVVEEVCGSSLRRCNFSPSTRAPPQIHPYRGQWSTTTSTLVWCTSISSLCTPVRVALVGVGNGPP